MNNKNIDTVISSFKEALPYGVNYSDLTSDLKINYVEIQEIKKYLQDNNIISDWGDPTMQILTQKGEEIINIYGGIEKFITHETEENEEKKRILKITNEKLENDAKLSKWQVKTFWWVFGFGLFGGIYAIISIILSCTGESTDKKIERILESKLKAQPKIEHISVTPTSKKTPVAK